MTPEQQFEQMIFEKVQVTAAANMLRFGAVEVSCKANFQNGKCVSLKIMSSIEESSDLPRLTGVA